MEDLESKVKNVLENISRNFTITEKTEEQFYDILNSELENEGFLTGNNATDFETKNYFFPVIFIKLDIQSKSGINNRYYYSQNTPLSKEAKEDISNYRDLFNQTKQYLQKEIGERRIVEEEFEQKIIDFVDSKKFMKGIEPIKKQEIIETMKVFYKPNFNIFQSKTL